MIQYRPTITSGGWLTSVTAMSMVVAGSALSAFQSGPRVGSLYAGGLVQDAVNHKLILTGISYDSDDGTATAQSRCFISTTDVSQLADANAQTSVVIGKGDVLEACFTMAMIDGTDNFVIAGNSDPGGMYGSADVPTGFVMAMDSSSLATYVGGALASSQVSYPFSVIADADSSALYVATLTSSSMDLNQDGAKASSQNEQTNWVRHRKYGSSYEMTLHRIDYSKFGDNVGSLTDNWTSYFPITANSDGTKPDVYFAGMILKNNKLIAAGSTSGKGDGYGNANGDDEDGFLSVLDMSSGNMIESDRIGTSADDLVLGICHDPSDTENIYIVGSTKGAMASTATNDGTGFQPFVQKRSVSNLWDGVTWAAQWGSSGVDQPNVEAVDCLVAGDVVYVAGMAHRSSIIGDQFSMGGDDVFVAQLKTADGSVNWVKQIGTAGDDNLALGGALTLDEDGNLVVFGDTNGSFYRSRGASELTSDVFLVTMNKADGSIPDVASPNSNDNDNDNSDSNPVSGLLAGIQSGPSAGSLYAGGMIYDPKSDGVVLAGATFDSRFEGGSAASAYASGYLANAALVDGKVQEWTINSVMGDAGVEQAFSTLILHDSKTALAVGSAGAGSSLLSGTTPGAMMVAFNINDLEGSPVDGAFDLQMEGKYMFPVSVASDSAHVYIVSLTSSADSDFSDVQSKVDLVGTDIPFSVNRMDSETSPPDLFMTVSKKLMVGGALIDDWTHEFPFDQSDTIPHLSIGGIIVSTEYNYLAVVGSTNGIGPGYGDAVGTDEDGFVTLLDLNTGELATHMEANSIREGSSEDDIVTGICHDPNDGAAFYVVGGTRGAIGTQLSQSTQYPIPSGSLQAFLRKVDSQTLSELWTIQFGASVDGSDDPTMAYALDCEVIPGSELVYVGGIVHNNAAIVQGEARLQSSGGDDIWIGQVSALDGTVQWFEQVGSSGDDHMAPINGLVSTYYGNAVVFGDTNGAFARARSQSDLRDLIVLTFDISGGLVMEPAPAPVAVPTPTPESNLAPVTAPVEQPTEPMPTPAPVPIQPTPVESQPTNLTGSDEMAGAGESFWSVSTDEVTSQEVVGLIVGLVLGAFFFLLGLSIYCCCMRKKRRAAAAKRDLEKVEFVSQRGRRAADGIFSRYTDDPLSASLSSFRDDLTLGDPNLNACQNYADLKPNERDLI